MQSLYTPKYALVGLAIAAVGLFTYLASPSQEQLENLRREQVYEQMHTHKRELQCDLKRLEAQKTNTRAWYHMIGKGVEELNLTVAMLEADYATLIYDINTTLTKEAQHIADLRRQRVKEETGPLEDMLVNGISSTK